MIGENRNRPGNARINISKLRLCAPMGMASAVAAKKNAAVKAGGGARLFLTFRKLE